MTIVPDTSFVCKNIDVGAMNDAIDRQASSLEIVEALLGEVIPAEVETISDCQGCIDGEDRHKWQPVDYEERYVTEWQPVVSDKEQLGR
jgi:hypothetical protein